MLHHTLALLTRNVLAMDSMLSRSSVKHMNVDPSPPLSLRMPGGGVVLHCARIVRTQIGGREQSHRYPPCVVSLGVGPIHLRVRHVNGGVAILRDTNNTGRVGIQCTGLWVACSLCSDQP